MNYKSFKNKTIIITGSRMGIGFSLAEKLGEYGANLVINARNAEKLELTKQQLESKGYNVLAIPGDISNADTCEKIVKATIDKFGEIHILINNAGMSGKGAVEQSDISVFHNQVNINILGSVYMTKYTIPYIKNTRGSVLFVSSLAGIRGLPYYSGYSASKMALTGFAESLKIELHRDNVHVGLAYVSFTENDPGKQFYNKDGKLETLEKRSKVKAMPIEKTVDLILKQILKRKFKVVHSFMGKTNWVISKVFPKLIEFIFIKSINKFK